ncbi:hypothetical protein BTA51_22135 [Hahella sp. CCB-MM4]|uniref:hypothetical protein n=1 Tax=Hahella sp. (strain CCB-MM4) TaxID=1926491 RepID=UPI000B9C3373|nr:hypothetical protein [Hahella sp. CCB-MM4]OZG71083.1 hypothetical protein BTA51_22135 [Hahella sp. CCB-MM4]
MRILILLAILLSGWLTALSAQALEIGGRVKFEEQGNNAGADTPEAMLGHKVTSQTIAQLRLEASQTLDTWMFDAAWQLDGRHGSVVEKDRALQESYPALTTAGSDFSYWDLDGSLVNDQRDELEQRIDRLSLTFTENNLVVRLGRQALTWGSGQVFHPMDLVNPFQPVATDTAYKRGTDMAYLQWLFDSGADVQLVVVPHKRRGSEDANAGKATQAVFGSIPGDTLQWNLLLANDRADTVFGLGVTGPVGEALWNLEVIPTHLDGGGTKTSALMNLTYAGFWLQRNLSAYVELYHNGFGESGSYTLAELNGALANRLERGQQFVTGRDYLSVGATWDWTPLIQLTPTMIFNLHDQSALFDAQISWSLSDEITIKAGGRMPAGDQGTELGGLELAPETEMFLGQQRQWFIRGEVYF